MQHIVASHKNQEASSAKGEASREKLHTVIKNLEKNVKEVNGKERSSIKLTPLDPNTIKFLSPDHHREELNSRSSYEAPEFKDAQKLYELEQAVKLFEN